MSSIATIVAVGTVASAAGSAVASRNASKQAKKQYEADLNTQQMNKLMFDQSRGSEGSANYATYLQRTNGDMVEGEMAQDAIKAYDEMGGQTYDDYKWLADKFRPAQDLADKRGASIFDGGLQADMLKNFEPVKTARTAFKRQSAIDSLNKTLGAIEAMNATKGYTGDSYGKRRLTLDSNRGAADAIAGANLQNLEEERSIKDAILNLQLNNLDQPTKSARNAMEFETAPRRAYADSIGLRQSLFAPFRIGTAQHRYEPINLGYRPSVAGSVLSSVGSGMTSIGTGMMAGGGGGGGGGGGSPEPMYAASNFQNQLNQQKSPSLYGQYPGAGAYKTDDLANWNASNW